MERGQRRITLAGGGLQHVADQDQRGLGEERIDHRGVAGRASSSMSDSLIAFQPAIDEPSNMVPLVEEVLIDHRQVEGDMLPLAARVGEADVDDI